MVILFRSGITFFFGFVVFYIFFDFVFFIVMVLDAKSFSPQRLLGLERQFPLQSRFSLQ